MCMSPQIKKISVNNSFKKKEKILPQKKISNIDYNKISFSKNLTSRNNEKLNSKNKSKKVINSLNKNKNPFVHIFPNKNSNKKNDQNHFINYNYDIINPQTTRYSKQYSTSNLLLDTFRNKASFPYNYFKLNQTNNNCNFSLNHINDSNNKITKIEINNINYNNGQNIVIKNISGTQTTKDSNNSNKINKDIIFSICDNFNNNNSFKFNKNILNDKNNKVIKSLKMNSPGAFSISRHFSSQSSMNLLGENKLINNQNINNINTPTSNSHMNSSSNNIFLNNNFFSKIQNNYIEKNKNKNKNKNKDKNKIKKLNKYLNQSNNNKCNTTNRLIDTNFKKRYLNNNSNDKILLNNTDIKKNNLMNNQKVINGINITGINIIKNKNYFSNNKTERNNNIHNKNNKNSLSIKRIDKCNNDVESKKYSFIENYEKEGLLYKKNNKFKAIYSNYFYDINKNILKNASPEENHFKTIIFLQKMKSNNKSII